MKDTCSVSVEMYRNVNWGLLTIPWVHKTTAKNMNPLEQQFQGVVAVIAIRMRAVCAPTHKGKPGIKLDLRNLHNTDYKHLKIDGRMHMSTQIFTNRNISGHRDIR
jgi:hypothetical protein